jgi:hypothetical protein
MPNVVTPSPARALSIPPRKVGSKSSVRFTVTSAIRDTLTPRPREATVRSLTLHGTVARAESR